MKNFFVGTSGWNYLHWKEVFYPKNLSQNKWLEYYTNFFNSVELNVTFYRRIKEETFKKWHRLTPKNFYFVVKGSRLITHIKKLKNSKEEIEFFLKNALTLGEKLSCILWQFPPNYKKNLESLQNFLKLLNRYKIREAFEFRHISWFDKEIYDLLKYYNFSLCIADSNYWPSIKEITADFVYLRFHGRDGLYRGDYNIQQLNEWAEFVKKLNLDTFAFFNNDAYGYAVKNALDFKKLLEDR